MKLFYDIFPQVLAGVIVLLFGYALGGFRSKSKRKINLRNNIIQNYYVRSDSSSFQQYVEKRFTNTRRIILIGIGLNILHRDPLRQRIMERAAKNKCTLEIYLANPNSPTIQERLIEEELGDEKPPVAKQGLCNRLTSLLKQWEKLGKPKSITIKLFNNYPTFGLLIFDSDFFIYPYGFAMVGNYSPLFHFSSKTNSQDDIVSFFEGQYNRIKNNSVDAEIAYIAKDFKSQEIDNLVPFALFFVPPADSQLYRFGSNVLGYDVRKKELISSNWENYIGKALHYGFHLTICDALYFVNKAEIENVIARIEFIANEIHPFYLNNLKLKLGFPDENSVSILLSDTSGSLEILHHEYVHHVYSFALGSNYSFHLENFDRDTEKQRAISMIKRYNAPYILQKYQPHFTLLTKIPSDQREKVFQELNGQFNNEVKSNQIRVSNMAIMTKSKNDSSWIIEKEIKLL